MANVKFRCQGSHSRNGLEWTYETDPSGRHVLKANKKGVWARLGKVGVHIFAQGGRLRRAQILTFLQKLHASFTDNDLGRVYDHFTLHGLITTEGQGADSLWILTAKGRTIMANWRKSASVEWV